MDAAGAVLVCAVEGTGLTDAEREFLRDAAVSGVTLFGRNVPKDPGTWRDLALLTRDLQRLRPSWAPPLVIAIDQEGGRVARIRASDFPEAGPALKLAGGRDDAESLQKIATYGSTMGEALRKLGVNVNFAPVADLDTEPTNTAIGDRCFASAVEPAVKRAGAFLGGMQAAGVLGCLKHFPGQGDAKVDTHAARAVIDLPEATLRARELLPFRALLPHVPMVMISHCIYPALASEPASLSAKIMRDLLRRELGFGGVVVSDDMNMGAIAQDLGAWGEAIVEAVAQGADMVLVCRHLEKCRHAYDSLSTAAAKSASFARRLDEAAARVLALRTRLRA